MRGYPSKERKLSFLNLSQFGNSELAWEYSANTYKTTVQRSVAVQAIVQKFDQMMYADTNIYGFAILSGDRRNVVSTVEKKSRTGVMKIDEKTRDILEECKESYPFVKWVSGESLDVGMTEAFYCMVNRPVLLGIVALGEAEKTEEDSYLCVALDGEQLAGWLYRYGDFFENGSSNCEAGAVYAVDYCFPSILEQLSASNDYD